MDRVVFVTLAAATLLFAGPIVYVALAVLVVRVVLRRRGLHALLVVAAHRAMLEALSQLKGRGGRSPAGFEEKLQHPSRASMG